MKGPSKCCKTDNSYHLVKAPFKILMSLDYKLSKWSWKPKENVHLAVGFCATQGKNRTRGQGGCFLLLCCTHGISASFPPHVSLRKEDTKIQPWALFLPKVNSARLIKVRLGITAPLKALRSPLSPLIAHNRWKAGSAAAWQWKQNWKFLTNENTLSDSPCWRLPLFYGS